MTDSLRDALPAFNLHTAAHANTVAGFTSPLRLQSHQAAQLASSLRGMEAIARVLVAVTGEDCSDTALIVGDYLRSGLLEAIVSMAANAGEMLETLNNQAKAAQTANQHLR